MQRRQRTVEKKTVAVIVLILLAVSILMLCSGMEVHASELLDNTINERNEYSKYGLENYQLDFYVDNSWAWLPWNWGEGIGNSVMYGVYMLTNFMWILSNYISQATGYVVQEAFRLDFITDMSDAIGTNIQTLTGVSPAGFSTEGFYPGLLFIFIFIIGLYVAYVGVLKRETSKAVSALVHFFVVFLVSTIFIAYAPTYIGKINEFSTDVSNGALRAGTSMTLPDAEQVDRDSTDLLRDSLFMIQVKQPWMILQYGTTDIEESRSEGLLKKSPDGINVSGEEGDNTSREDVVKKEIEEFENTYMTTPKVATRLGMVFFIFIFNLIISIFVFLLSGMMILSQVLFIVYAMYLPISLLLSMLPTYSGLAKRAVEKFFNTIMHRAGIILIVTVAFSISTMFYSLTDGYPFLMIAFLQIVTFAGIFMKMNDIMSLFGLQGNDAEQVGRRLLMRPRMAARRMQRRVMRGTRQALRTGAAGAVGGFVGARVASGKNAGGGTTNKRSGGNSRRGENGQSVKNTADQNPKTTKHNQKSSLGQRAGKKVGELVDMPNKIKSSIRSAGEKVKTMPTNARYSAYAGKKRLRKNLEDFKESATSVRAENQDNRAERRETRRREVDGKRNALKRHQTVREGAKRHKKTDAGWQVNADTVRRNARRVVERSTRGKNDNRVVNAREAEPKTNREKGGREHNERAETVRQGETRQKTGSGKRERGTADKAAGRGEKRKRSPESNNSRRRSLGRSSKGRTV